MHQHVGHPVEIAADSIVCRFFDMDPMKIGHLRLASREKLGTVDSNSIDMGRPLNLKMRLRPKRAFMDYLAVLTFKSKLINKAIMNSPVTPLLYQCLKPLRSAKEEARYHDDIGGLPKSQFRSR